MEDNPNFFENGRRLHMLEEKYGILTNSNTGLTNITTNILAQ